MQDYFCQITKKSEKYQKIAEKAALFLPPFRPYYYF